MYEFNELVKISKMYYEMGMTQKEISEVSKHSRPTISRMLEAAMERGIVRVQIEYPLDSIYELEEEIKNKFHLKKVFVAPTFVEEDTLIVQDVGKALANYLTEICRPNDILGISWGTTLGVVSNYLPKRKINGLKIVQLNGGIPVNSYSNGSFGLLEKFSEAFEGQFHLLSAPTIVDSEEIANSILSDSNIKQVVDLGKKANIALFGIGRTHYESVLYKSGYFKTESYDRLISKGAVGDICSRFFDINGDLVDSELNRRTIGLQLEDLQEKEHCIAMAVGAKKVKAVYGALQGNYLNTLFVDEHLARKLLNYKEE
ncbi:MAG: sugar-binding transcriptional regulator [Bacillota bacterium]